MESRDCSLLRPYLSLLLLIPDQDLDYVGLLEMVIEINRTEVPEEDVLADNVYKYDRSKNQIVILEGQEK